MDGAVSPEQSVAPATQHCDVIVIGGGPGGSAAAAHLAKAGLNVVLVERERHPRFHIGESLLPGSMPLLEDLGVIDDVRRIGVYKPGAEFISEDGQAEIVFEFSRTLFEWPDHAYQVRRAEFDKILFDRAIALGAIAYQETAAKILTLEDEHALVETHGPSGERKTWNARFLIDASGRSTLVSKALDQRRPDPHNTSAAIFAHFRGIPRKIGPHGGNIRIHLTRPGWMWQIPLRDDITSVGWVAPGKVLEDRNCGIEAFFDTHCNRHPHLAAMFAEAERIGPLRSTGNFSYRATKAANDCHIKVGDAYGFIDPIFSTGVHLALISAEEAAKSVLQVLKAPGRRRQTLDRYHRQIEKRLRFVSWFIYQIHDPAFRHMMVNPKNIFGVEQALISLLAADFRNDPRLRARIALFKLFRYTVGKI